MAGNVFDMTVKPSDRQVPAFRGGGYFFERITLWTVNRWIGGPSFRESAVGLRVCASLAAP